MDSGYVMSVEDDTEGAHRYAVHAQTLQFGHILRISKLVNHSQCHHLYCLHGIQVVSTPRPPLDNTEDAAVTSRSQS